MADKDAGHGLWSAPVETTFLPAGMAHGEVAYEVT